MNNTDKQLDAIISQLSEIVSKLTDLNWETIGVNNRLDSLLEEDED